MVSAPPIPTNKTQSKKKQKEQQPEIRPDSTQKEKKRKKKQHEDANTCEAKAAEPGRKDETSNLKDNIRIADVPIPYTNPLTDESCLAYAYQYAQHVSLSSESERAAKQPWKFNKARQNWILRNVIEPATIPDSYLPISLIYVQNIQGGARNELKKTCKVIKKQAKNSKASPSSDSNGSKPEADQPSEAKSESTKKVTFAAGTTEPKVTESEISAPSKVKVKRAKIILKVLKGEIRPQDV
ncbi:hypothetical protein RhiXN_00674 [Rhizoctonia solani]|uniref:WKF domain-containing protein n=1 Tax=Rhizoctonia solani TaxID=456999 RepID=A0A8H8NVT6_9AGAM|nr:uncharacterized protein RhiXN_00674 [Rhizoctonia solani]QRW19268.1 hypothetical protein RhiXN_00674 [Rhizoctonia solani]